MKIETRLENDVKNNYMSDSDNYKDDKALALTIFRV